MAKQAQKKLTKTELNNLQKLVKETSELKSKAQDLDIAHAVTMEKYLKASNKLDALGNKLEDKYGSVNINIETGEIAPDEPEQE